MTNTALGPLLAVGARPATAKALGVSEKRLRNRLLHRPFHGVVTIQPPTRLEELCRAYLAVRPPGGFFSGPTAAVLHGLPLPRPLEPPGSEPLHVSVPAPARAPRRGGIAGHSTRIALGDVVVRGDLPLSSPERAWCELGTLLEVEDLVVAGDWLVREASTPARLRAALARFPGRRGRPALQQALALLDPRSESPQESRLRHRLLLAGVDGFAPNLPIVASSGRRYRGDLVFPAERVILEYQGDHHREREAYRRDLSRRLDLQADGWTVVELGPDDIADAALGARVRAILGLPASAPA